MVLSILIKLQQNRELLTYPLIRLIWSLWYISCRTLFKKYWTLPIWEPFTSCRVYDFFSDLLNMTFVRTSSGILSISFGKKQASAYGSYSLSSPWIVNGVPAGALILK